MLRLNFINFPINRSSGKTLVHKPVPLFGRRDARNYKKKIHQNSHQNGRYSNLSWLMTYPTIRTITGFNLYTTPGKWRKHYITFSSLQSELNIAFLDICIHMNVAWNNRKRSSSSKCQADIWL